MYEETGETLWLSIAGTSSIRSMYYTQQLSKYCFHTSSSSARSCQKNVSYFRQYVTNLIPLVSKCSIMTLTKGLYPKKNENRKETQNIRNLGIEVDIK